MRTLLACLLLAVGCDTTDSEGAAPATTEVRYALAWDWTGATPLVGGGWAVETLEGVRVEVHAGYLVDYGLELVECPEAATAGLLDTLVGTAWAGHDDEYNPIAVQGPRVESLVEPAALALDVRPGTGLAYCQAHYLVARAPSYTEGLPDDVEMERYSLYLAGTWAPAGGEPTPFTVHTRLANGALRDVAPTLGTPLDTAAEGATITVTRRLGTLFEGVDLGADEDTVARALLTNLLEGVSLEVTPVAAE